MTRLRERVVVDLTAGDASPVMVKCERDMTHGAVTVKRERGVDLTHGAVKRERDMTHGAVKRERDPTHGAVKRERDPTHGAVKRERDLTHGAVTGKRRCLSSVINQYITPEHRPAFIEANTLSSQISAVTVVTRARAVDTVFMTADAIDKARTDVNVKVTDHAILMHERRQRLNLAFDTEKARMTKLSDPRSIARSLDLQMNVLTQLRMVTRLTNMQLHAEEEFNLGLWKQMKQLKGDLLR